MQIQWESLFKQAISWMYSKGEGRKEGVQGAKHLPVENEEATVVLLCSRSLDGEQ
jgi:hypothetical protein